MSTPEGDVLSAILGLLQAEHIVAWRMNVGGTKFGDSFVSFGVKGFADILAIPTVSGSFKGFRCQWTTPLFIEVKGLNGRQTPEQKSFQRQVVDAGADYLLARSVPDVENWLSQHGVKQ